MFDTNLIKQHHINVFHCNLIVGEDTREKKSPVQIGAGGMPVYFGQKCWKRCSFAETIRNQPSCHIIPETDGKVPLTAERRAFFLSRVTHGYTYLTLKDKRADRIVEICT